MKEVSCRVFEILIRAVAEKGIPLERMVEGTSVTVAVLRDKDERIDWAECCAVMANLRPIFTDAEYVEIGRTHFRSSMLRFVFVVARLLFTPMGFYRWLNKPREGVGNQLFTCIVPSTREISNEEIEVDLIVRDGYEICWEFFTITSGNFMEMPRLLGYPAAKVELTRLTRGMRFHITVPSRPTFLTRVRRVLTWPFTVRAAARELQEAHETLVERYEQLEDARAKLDQQAAQLRTAHAVNELIHGDLDLDRTLATITRALVEQAGFAGAEIRLSANLSDEEMTSETRHGATDGAEPLCRGLEVQGGQRIGDLRAFADPAADHRERDELLDFIVPTVAMAIHNALSYRAVEDYRRGLERRVDERTRDLRSARDELADTVVHLEEARAGRERIFQNISHEIRTPLSLILLSVDDVLASHRDALDDRAVAHLGTVTTSARKLVRLVDELLLLAAGQERQLAVRPEPIDLATTLAEVVAGWGLAAQAAGLQVTADAPDGVVAAADPVALERVLSNLLSNAVKFTPPGGRVTVTVTPGDPIRVAVADTGLGVDEDLRQRLFGRFEQGTGGVASRGGSGIGLSIVLELVRAHGGEVGCDPNPGGGTIFWFTLPPAEGVGRTVMPRLRPGDFGAPEVEPQLTERLTPPVPSQGLILIAEDDLDLARSLAKLLAKEHTVLVAHDGATALALAEQHHPDLLVTDVSMPGMDGIELTVRFNALTRRDPAPVLVLSARAELDDRLLGLAAGAVDYLVKPFDPSELMARVRAQLEHRQLTQRLYRAEKLASLGTLSAGLAHELRNPANGIVNAVGPLRDLLPPAMVEPEQPVSQLLDVMAECADQVAFLSRQLLGFRRGGDLELRRVPIDDIVSRALANASAALSGVEVRTELRYQGLVRCAPPLLAQVLVNLLENAAHAAGPGGWVEITSRRGGGHVSIEVADSGPGVAADLTEKVFEPFFTTKPPGQGTGLGLATSRDLMHRHGGTLEIRTRGERQVFCAELPEPVEVPAAAGTDAASDRLS